MVAHAAGTRTGLNILCSFAIHFPVAASLEGGLAKKGHRGYGGERKRSAEKSCRICL
jgi:hypothetical protein